MSSSLRILHNQVSSIWAAGVFATIRTTGGDLVPVRWQTGGLRVPGTYSALEAGLGDKPGQDEGQVGT